ncbi:MAG TPA: hypothetical protein VHM93_08910 [Candidatus Acidoferrum sp.]|nr:hypothetical protein [Candidatus Acidoferrum sp.]
MDPLEFEQSTLGGAVLSLEESPTSWWPNSRSPWDSSVTKVAGATEFRVHEQGATAGVPDSSKSLACCGIASLP